MQSNSNSAAYLAETSALIRCDIDNDLTHSSSQIFSPFGAEW